MRQVLLGCILFGKGLSGFVDLGALSLGRPLLFGTEGTGLRYFLTPTGFLLQLYQMPSLADAEEVESSLAASVPTYTIEVRFVSSSAPTIRPESPLPAPTTFYVAGQKATHCASYAFVRYQGVWPGVDVLFRHQGNRLEYDFLLAPGTPDSLIRLQVIGASVQVEAGELVFRTPLGEIRQKAPKAWAGPRLVAASWKVSGDTYGIAVEGRPRSETLFIDPIILSWSTYLGGEGDDIGWSVTTDPQGNIYIAGWTTSFIFFPITTGSHQVTYGGGTDAFLAKFSPSGQLLWSTYFGSDSLEIFYAIHYSPTGQLYCVGTTRSPTGIATPNAYQPSYGGDGDGLIAVFDTLGTLLWSTYVGGPFTDRLRSVSADSLGHLYAIGATSSTGLGSPSTSQPSYGGGASDAFLVKFSSTGALLWATYLGGTGEEEGYFCFYQQGGIFVSGATGSLDFPVSAGAYQTQYGGGLWDGFLGRYDTAGQRLWLTYYGGEDRDWLYGVSATPTSEVYATGSTGSRSGIASPGSFQSQYSGGSCDGFLVKFSAQGTRLWATYFGGDTNDWGYRCIASPQGQVFIAGWTRSRTGIATSDAPQPTHGGSVYDGFLMIFSPSGYRIWGTYIGGTGIDWARECALSPAGILYATGYTSSPGLATPGSFQEVNKGGVEAFLACYADSSAVSFLPHAGSKASTWTFSPNPSAGTISLYTPVPATFVVWALSGEELRRISLPSGTHTVSLALPQGVYLLQREGERNSHLLWIVP